MESTTHTMQSVEVLTPNKVDGEHTQPTKPEKDHYLWEEDEYIRSLPAEVLEWLRNTVVEFKFPPSSYVVLKPARRVPISPELVEGLRKAREKFDAEEGEGAVMETDESAGATESEAETEADMQTEPTSG